MNTINVCIGHLPFPKKYSNFVDLLISPNIVEGDIKIKSIVPDEMHGVNGHSLSEYSQLFWLLENLDEISEGKEFLNIFQYRRFISPTPVDEGEVTGLPWEKVVMEDHLDKYAHCFNRNQHSICFNTPVDCGDAGVISQYKSAHVLEDYLSFCQFLLEEGILDGSLVVKFIQQKIFVPACSVGIYSIDSFRNIFKYLKWASNFINSSRFKDREGYQRRSAGYLLERFHSYLILEHFGKSGNFGNNILINPAEYRVLSKNRVL